MTPQTLDNISARTARTSRTTRTTTTSRTLYCWRNGRCCSSCSPCGPCCPCGPYGPWRLSSALLLAALAAFAFLGATPPAFAQTYSASGMATLQGRSDHSGVTIAFSRVSSSGTNVSSVLTATSGSWSRSGFTSGTTYRARPDKDGWNFSPSYRDFSVTSSALDFSGAPEARQWTWMKGASTIGEAGIYGTQGVAATSNTPGARDGAVSWTDTSGTLWLFGGEGQISCPNDLWKYETTSEKWTWMKGATTGSLLGIYGTQGVAATSNTPGARHGAVSWLDASGSLWLFGGELSDKSATLYNDLWKYELASGNWTWLKGASTWNQDGIYGIQGEAATSNTPGARIGASSWLSASGELWLFGGYEGGLSEGDSDLWKYNPVTGNWTWMKGASTHNQSGIYGTLGEASTTNTPGARGGAASWTDPSGALWLFGGYGYDRTGSTGCLNDLWKYDPAANTWTWMNGASAINQPGIYGIRGVSAPSNVPGARTATISWMDASGTFWLLGGYGYLTSAIPYVILGDLWNYSPANNTWTWMRGASIASRGAYGRQGIGDPANAPGGRQNAVSWMDASGALWLFGGYGNDQAGHQDWLNDLWRFGEASTCTLKYIAGANGDVVGATSQTIMFGADGTTVTAVPEAGYNFLQWSDGLTRNPRQDTNVTTDITVTVLFISHEDLVMGLQRYLLGLGPLSIGFDRNGDGRIDISDLIMAILKVR